MQCTYGKCVRPKEYVLQVTSLAGREYTVFSGLRLTTPKALKRIALDLEEGLLFEVHSTTKITEP